MNRPCTLTLLVGCTWAMGSAWAEPLPRPRVAEVQEGAAADQWQYHEKWDQARPQRRPGAQGVACPPSGPPQGAVRAVPPAGRCPDATRRVRT